MTTYAILGDGGILVGYERGSDEIPAGASVLVDDECDLQVGRYYWDGTKFIPLPPAGSANAAKEVNVLRAIFRGFQAIETRFPNTLPKETKEWLEQFSKSIDNVKAI